VVKASKLPDDLHELGTMFPGFEASLGMLARSVDLDSKLEPGTGYHEQVYESLFENRVMS
jgi:hypothetical protein